MRHAKWNIGLHRKAHGLRARFNHAVAFVARMIGVDASFFVYHAQERKNFVVIRIATRRINLPGREPKRTFANAAAQHGLHSIEFACVWFAVFITHCPEAQSAVTDKAFRRDRVLQRAEPQIKPRGTAKKRKITGQIRIRRNPGDKARKLRGTDAARGKERNAALPRNLRGDALIEFAERGIGADERQVAVRVRVDESGYERKPARIEYFVRLRQLVPAKNTYFSAIETDGARKRGSAGSIIDHAILNQSIHCVLA